MSAPFGLHHAARFKGTVLFGTGHRPNKLVNLPWLDETLTRLLKWFRPPRVITGMALGFDTILALKCIELGIPFTAAVPFEGQEKLWPETDQLIYRDLLKAAESVHVVSPYANLAAFNQRNAWMVQNATHGLACWDSSRGGTWHAVMYARSQRKHVTVMDPTLRRVSGPTK